MTFTISVWTLIGVAIGVTIGSLFLPTALEVGNRIRSKITHDTQS